MNRRLRCIGGPCHDERITLNYEPRVGDGVQVPIQVPLETAIFEPQNLQTESGAYVVYYTVRVFCHGQEWWERTFFLAPSDWTDRAALELVLT